MSNRDKALEIVRRIQQEAVGPRIVEREALNALSDATTVWAYGYDEDAPDASREMHAAIQKAAAALKETEGK